MKSQEGNSPVTTPGLAIPGAKPCLCHMQATACKNYVDAFVTPKT